MNFEAEQMFLLNLGIPFFKKGQRVILAPTIYIPIDKIKHIKQKFRKASNMLILWQLLGFMFVGTLGVGVNAVVFQSLLRTKVGAKKIVSLPAIKNIKFLQSHFPDITLAWGFGILAAFVFNFILNKYFIFRV